VRNVFPVSPKNGLKEHVFGNLLSAF